MNLDRLAECRELLESSADPLDRADLESQMEAEWWGSCGSPLGDGENSEMWRRVLTAYIQPLPDAAD